jgi:ComF family protein
MPLHAARYRERGFNQAEVIAGHVASRLGLQPDTTLLVRVRHTAAQTTLTAAERRRNCEGAFAVRPGRRVPARVALLDDVMTTGSTAAAAATALHAAGARHVQLWVCAAAARGVHA